MPTPKTLFLVAALFAAVTAAGLLRGQTDSTVPSVPAPPSPPNAPLAPPPDLDLPPRPAVPTVVALPEDELPPAGSAANAEVKLYPSLAKPPAESALRVIALRHCDAREVAQVVRQLYDEDGLSTAVEERTNSIILRGEPARLDEVSALLERLDSSATPSAGAAQVRRYVESGRTAAQPAQTLREAVPTPGVELHKMFVPLVAPGQYGYVPVEEATSAQVGAIRNMYHERDRQAQRLAEQYRRDAATAADEARDEMRGRLREAVREAFAARQELQRGELDALRERLSRIERQLQMREQLRDKIVERRVDELLNPDLRWDERARAPSTAVTSAAGAEPPAPARVPPAAVPAPNAVWNAVPPVPALPGVVGELRFDPSGLPTPLAPRSDLATMLRKPDEFVSLFLRLKSDIRKREPLDEPTDLLKASLEMLRAEFTAQLALLESEVQAATSALEAAQAEHDRLANLVAQGAASDAGLPRAKAAVQRAAAQQRQVSALLNLYRKADELLSIEPLDDAPAASNAPPAPAAPDSAPPSP